MLCTWNGLNNCGKGQLFHDGKMVAIGGDVNIDPDKQKPAVQAGLKPAAAKSVRGPGRPPKAKE